MENRAERSQFCGLGLSDGWYSIMFFIHPTSLAHLHIMYMRPAQIPPLLKNILFTDIQKVQTATTVSFTKGVETDLDYATQREMLILLQPFS